MPNFELILFSLLSFIICYFAGMYHELKNLQNVANYTLGFKHLIEESDGKARLTIFDTNGKIVGDSVIKQTDSVDCWFCNHYSLNNPQVTSITWEKIRETPLMSESTYNFTDGETNWTVSTVHPSFLNLEYYISIFIKIEDAILIRDRMQEKYLARYDL